MMPGLSAKQLERRKLDVTLLATVLDDKRLTDNQVAAFTDMMAHLDTKSFAVLTAPQRAFVEGVAKALEIDLDDAPDPTVRNAFVDKQKGSAWGTAEPEVLRRENLPKKPPPARRVG